MLLPLLFICLSGCKPSGPAPEECYNDHNNGILLKVVKQYKYGLTAAAFQGDSPVGIFYFTYDNWERLKFDRSDCPEDIK